MNASMSSRRVVLHQHRDIASVASIVAFVAGIVFAVVAAKTNISWFAIPGFVGIAGSILYWNTMFWARYYDKHPRQ